MKILSFKANRGINAATLLENGFKVTRKGNYLCEKFLYDNLVKLNVYYAFETIANHTVANMVYSVTNASEDLYLPFHTGEFENDPIAKEVVNNFNHFMKDLVKKEIILDNKPEGETVKKPKDSKTIKIKYHDSDLIKLEKNSKGDWIDLRCSEDVELKAGDFKLLPLGVSMSLPYGYEAHIVPRSSTFKNYGIIQTNHMGIVDRSYCGDNDQWMMAVYATRDTLIHKNDRVCQFRIMRNQPFIYFDEVETLGNKSRGGFGSTGVK